MVLAGFTAFIGLYATQPLLPLLMRVFDASHFDVSLTITAATIAVAIAAPGVGRVADLAGRRRVIVCSAFILGVATLLCATSASLKQFIAWRFVQGLVTPGIFAITIAYIHDQYPAWYAGRASAAYVSGTVLGGFSGRVLVGLLADVRMADGVRSPGGCDAGDRNGAGTPATGRTGRGLTPKRRKRGVTAGRP